MAEIPEVIDVLFLTPKPMEGMLANFLLEFFHFRAEGIRREVAKFCRGR